MPYTLTLNSIYDTDLSKVGYRALDLAKIFQSKYRTPLSFVVPNVIFDEFMVQTRLKHDINNILSKSSYEDSFSLEEAYKEIKTLFSRASIPQEFVEPLREAYDSLAIGSDEGRAIDLLSEETPIVNLIVSPDYIVGTEDIKGVLMNIKGFESFLNGLASCWLSMYSPEAILYRHKRDIKEFNIGVVVQKMIVPRVCAEAYSKGPLGNYEFKVKSYLGLPDILKESSKDIFSVSKEYLKIESTKKMLQEYMIIPSKDPNLLIKESLGSRGQDQSLSDKEVIEVARLTKRINEELDVHFKAYYLIKNELIYFFFVNRLEDVRDTNIKDISTADASETNSKKDEQEDNYSSEETIEEETPEMGEDINTSDLDMFNEPPQESFTEVRAQDASRESEQFQEEQEMTSQEPIKEEKEEFVEQEEVKENVEMSSQPNITEEPTQADGSSPHKEVPPEVATENKEYFKRLIEDTVMDVDNEIRRRYIEIFGYFQESMDYDIALERLHEKTGLPDKEDLSKLKDLLYTFDKKETPEKSTISKLLDSAKRFIDG